MSPPAFMLRVHFMTLACAASVGPGVAKEGSLWDDRGVKVIQTVEMRFPPSLLFEGVTQGEVRAVLEVNADGKLADFLVTAFTHRQLAQELQAALPTFEFEPARQRGEPVGSRFEVAFNFESRGAVLSLTPMASVGAQLRGTLADPMFVVVARTADLDRPVAAVHQVSPFHPGRSLKPPIESGTVQVDFYIDSTGRPRMPVVMRATHEQFAAAAVDALLQWRFAPPTRKGHPVAVRVVQEFVFAPILTARRSS